MPDLHDPFTGTWTFSAPQSRLSTPAPRRWVQQIFATPEEIVVHEDIVRGNGVPSTVRVWARFDGTDYPIFGLPIADATAYLRPGARSISVTGKKDGELAFMQTITISHDDRFLTLVYSVQNGASQVSRGKAVFEKTLPGGN